MRTHVIILMLASLVLMRLTCYAGDEKPWPEAPGTDGASDVYLLCPVNDQGPILESLQIKLSDVIPVPQIGGAWLEHGPSRYEAEAQCFSRVDSESDSSKTSVGASLSGSYGLFAASLKAAKASATVTGNARKTRFFAYGRRESISWRVKPGVAGADKDILGDAVIRASPMGPFGNLLRRCKNFSDPSDRGKAIKEFYQIYGKLFVSSISQLKMGNIVLKMTSREDREETKDLMSVSGAMSYGAFAKGSASFSKSTETAVSEVNTSMSSKVYVYPTDSSLLTKLMSVKKDWDSYFSGGAQVTTEDYSLKDVAIDAKPVKEIAPNKDAMQRAEDDEKNTAKLKNNFAKLKDAWDSMPPEWDKDPSLITKSMIKKLDDMLTIIKAIEKGLATNNRNNDTTLNNQIALMRSTKLCIELAKEAIATTGDAAKEAMRKAAEAKKKADEEGKYAKQATDYIEKMGSEDGLAFSAWLKKSENIDPLDFTNISPATLKALHIKWRESIIQKSANCLAILGLPPRNGTEDLFAVAKSVNAEVEEPTSYEGGESNRQTWTDLQKTEKTIYDGMSVYAYSVRPWVELFPYLDITGDDDITVMAIGAYAERLNKHLKKFEYVWLLSSYGNLSTHYGRLAVAMTAPTTSYTRGSVKGLLYHLRLDVLSLWMQMLRGGGTCNVLGRQYSIWNDTANQPNWETLDTIVEDVIQELNDWTSLLGIENRAKVDAFDRFLNVFLNWKCSRGFAMVIPYDVKGLGVTDLHCDRYNEKFPPCSRSVRGVAGLCTLGHGNVHYWTVNDTGNFKNFILKYYDALSIGACRSDPKSNIATMCMPLLKDTTSQKFDNRTMDFECDILSNGRESAEWGVLADKNVTGSMLLKMPVDPEPRFGKGSGEGWIVGKMWESGQDIHTTRKLYLVDRLELTYGISGKGNAEMYRPADWYEYVPFYLYRDEVITVLWPWNIMIEKTASTGMCAHELKNMKFINPMSGYEIGGVTNMIEDVYNRKDSY